MTNPFLTSAKNLTSEGFPAPGRASCFEARTQFRVPQNTTCRVLANTKIRPSGRIKSSRKRQPEAVLIIGGKPVFFCISGLIKIILQSKTLCNKAVHRGTMPKSASEGQ